MNRCSPCARRVDNPVDTLRLRPQRSPGHWSSAPWLWVALRFSPCRPHPSTSPLHTVTTALTCTDSLSPQPSSFPETTTALSYSTPTPDVVSFPLGDNRCPRTYRTVSELP